MIQNQNKKDSHDFGFWDLVGIAMLMAYLCLTSCMTNRKGELTEKGINFIDLHCKGEDSTVRTDNTIVLFDTVQIPYIVQGETIYLESPCDSLGRLKPVSIIKKRNGITGAVRSIGGVLAFDCKTDSLKYIIETQKRVISTFESNKTVIQAPCELEHITGTQWMWIRLGQILSSFLVLQVLIRVASIYVPFLKVLYVFKY